MRFAWLFAVAWSLGGADACVQREFGGVYTIVNQASGRRLIADERGFYTTSEASVSSTSMWHVLQDANATHVLQNVATGAIWQQMSRSDAHVFAVARIYAQQGADRERGFYLLDGETPVFRDQRLCDKCSGSLTLSVAKSKQILTLQSQLDEANARLQEAEEEAREVMVTLLLVTVAARRGWNNPEFHHQMVHVQEARWQKTLQFDFREGFFEFVEASGVADDAGDVTMMTPTSTMLTTLAIITTIIKIIIAISIASIESALHLTRVGTWTLPAFPGHLTLLFRETHYQDRTIRFAQHFSMDAFDQVGMGFTWQSTSKGHQSGDLDKLLRFRWRLAKDHGDECASSKSTAGQFSEGRLQNAGCREALAQCCRVQDADIQANQDAELGRDGAGSQYLGNAQVEDPDMRAPGILGVLPWAVATDTTKTCPFARVKAARQQGTMIAHGKAGTPQALFEAWVSEPFADFLDLRVPIFHVVFVRPFASKPAGLFNSPCSVRWLQNAMGSFKDKLLAAATIGGVVAVGMVFSSNPMLKAKAIDLTNFMRGNPILGVVLHSAFSTAITVSGIPFSLVDLGAAWVYGFRAAMCMLLFAKTLGSILCFLVARSVLPAARKASVLSHPTVARVDRILASSPIYYGTLFRLALLPTFVKNYGLALLNIRFPHYLTCCLLGSCLGVPAQAYLGSQLGDIYLGLREAESVDPVILWGGIAPVLFLVILMPTIAKVLLGKDEEPEASAKKAE
ncbi:hypothetical protein AK812_SmicGene7448 [Symbiodinium microadriaticum]|uniref:VTT domain-containing protein n=1 Tax=Symbiodinium microadriaticum TaxID=2951 RepID=A0A1Q9ENG1_SYMMI|nr:hypothetical protein AK812_SmicGene7448 [Symbiodinium microadriaticum]